MSSTAMPDIICRAQTLYPFYSEEEAALNFEKGDFIDVIAQLDTGWWDGICNGTRGWFPSNYVQVLGIDSPVSTFSPVDFPTSVSPPPTQYEWSDNTVYTAIVPESAQENWTVGTNNDHIKHPALPEDSQEKYNLPNSDRDDQTDTVTSSEGPGKESLAGRGLFMDDLPAPANPPAQTHIDSPADIMAQWVQRSTPQGRTYYCNLVTQESTWNWDTIDESTGRLFTTDEDDDDSDIEESYEDAASICPPSELGRPTSPSFHDAMTWESLAQDISHAVQQLTEAIQQADRSSFAQNVSTIVKVIRLMLFSARSMDKDALYVLQGPHESVLAALSKLVLSAKSAAESTLSTWFEKLNKVQLDASNVMSAARSFINVCKENHLDMGQVNPLLVDVVAMPELRVRDINDRPTAHSDVLSPRRPSQPSTKARFSLNTDLIQVLETHAKQISMSAESFSRSITIYIHKRRQQTQQQANDNEDKVSSSEIETQGDEDESNSNARRENEESYRARTTAVGLFYNLSMLVGQYLLVLQDIDFLGLDKQPLPAMQDYRRSKQKIYHAIGSLFNTIQNLTDPRINKEHCVGAMHQYLRTIEDSVGNTIYSIDQIIGHRKSLLLLSRRGLSDARLSTASGSVISSDASTATMPRSTSSEMQTRESEGSNDNDSLDTLIQGSPAQAYRQHVLFQMDPEKRRPSMESTTSRPSTATSADRSRRPSVARGVDLGSDPWFLGPDYKDEDILFATKDNSVRGGTLPALIERLTMHSTLDMNFINTFLLSYRSFCTTEEFVTLLEKRYSLIPPGGITADEYELWVERKQKLVRLRVFNIMKTWLENYYNDEDEFILSRLESFANTVIREASAFSADQLNRLVRKRKEMDQNGGGVLKKMVPADVSRPMPLLPKNLNNFKLTDIEPLELARQLCILDFKLYSNIRPIECLGKAWSRDDDGAKVATNIKQSIKYCNRLTAWVAGSILEPEEAKKRTVYIKYWAQVAERCRCMNNFNTCMAIISAFDNSSVGRLKKTWDLVGNRTIQMLASIRKLMGANRNFTEYREMIHSANPPCIPFLGIYLQDLTFIEDGNPDIIKNVELDLINFAKQQKSADVILEMKQFQSSCYTFQRVPEIQQFINTQLEEGPDVELLYDRSLRLEPRDMSASNH